ncbi:MAG: LysM peptidoglycan-binding domain-containing protein [Chromatiales bacterium]|nr:LysM peptidoglycan-binding domain-containing protein [Chromatiales bacterium]
MRLPSRCLYAACLLFAALPLHAELPRPPGLEPEIGFWRHIFTGVTTEQAVIHDNRHLGIVYTTIELPRGLSPAERSQRREQVVREYSEILTRLASGRRSGLSAEERRVLALWGEEVSNDELREAARRVRIQQGLSDRFEQGLVRAGQWRVHIRESLRTHGVPLALDALPHVESSFDPNAGSHAGALGLWQFMAGTGRQYMRVDDVLDERRDPYRSSEAAARLLRDNHAELGSWPVAITAYNHGVGGMRRALREMGTDDIETIVRQYSGPRFGFASRNFYVSLLAAYEADRNAEHYFGAVRPASPRPAAVVVMSDYISVDVLEQALGLPRAALREYNPALLGSVWQGRKHVPRGYALRLPQGQLQGSADQLLASVPPSARFRNQVPDALHSVRPGESLSVIARRYNTSVAELARLNGLDNRHLIRAGQQLRLPGAQAAPAVASAAPPAAGGTVGTYVVRPGDSLSLIATRTGVPVGTLAALNGISDAHLIRPGQELRLGSSGAETGPAIYVVRRGDSLSRIAERTGIPVATLMSLNGLPDAHRIFVGQRLRLRADAPSSLVRLAAEGQQ